MANKKAEILTMDGQVVSPITLATNVLLEDGRTAQDLLDSRDESMFSPMITTSSSISKVGQGDNVDFSENIIDGAYKSCVLKGKTLVNYNAEGNDRNEYVCMPSLEGNNLTVNGTVEGKVKSAILKGNTLVNLAQTFGYSYSWVGSTIDENNIVTADASIGSGYRWCHNPLNIGLIKPNTQYTVIVEVFENTLDDNLEVCYSGLNGVVYGTCFNQLEHIPIGFTGTYKVLATSKSNVTVNDQKLTTHIRLSNQTSGIVKYRVTILEGDYTNVDIPYFTGMQSVKMPVLTTTGKNLFDKNNVYENGFAISGYTKDRKGYDIKVQPNTLYTITSKGSLHYGFFNDDTQISSSYFDSNTIGNKTITTPTNCNILKLGLLDKGDTKDTDFDTFQIEQGSIATSYEPYKTNILTVNEDVVLRGIGDVRDELDLVTREMTQRVGEAVLDGSEYIDIFGQTDTHFRFSIGLKDSIKGEWGQIGVLCDNYPTTSQSIANIETEFIYAHTSNQLAFNIAKTKLETQDVDGFKKYLAETKHKIQYVLLNETIKTVDLSDNVVYSYKDTTHYTCSSEDGSLIPTLTIEEGVKYEVIIKPSTKYSIVFNRTEVVSGLTVDLGGATTSVTSSTLGKNIVQITTPSTLSHNYVIFKGLGNAIKDVQVIEGDVVGDEPYFEGMCDVEMPVVKNVGKNLCHINDYTITISNNNPSGTHSNSIIATNIPVKANTRYRVYFDTISWFDQNVARLNVFIDSQKTTLQTSNTHSNLYHRVHESGRGKEFGGVTNGSVITTDNQTKYIHLSLFNMVNVQGKTVTFNNISLVEESPTSSTYEPYKSNTVTFDQKDGKTIVLRSLPNGVCDTLDLETGEYVQRIGEIVFDGSENWSIPTNFSNGDCKGYSLSVDDLTSNIVCDGLKILPNSLKYGTEEGVFVSNNLLIVKKNIATRELFKQWLSQNPITVQYELATPIITTIDLKQHPFGYKDGYVVLTSSSEEISLTPTIEYSLIANRLGQIQTNQKLVEKQQAKIDELESMVITNLVNTQYQQALNEIKLGVK